MCKLKINCEFCKKIFFNAYGVFGNISKNFYMYLLIGTCTFSLDYFLYLFFLEHDINMNVAKASSSFIAVIFNYIFNSNFNFGGKNKMNLKYLSICGFVYSMLILLHVIMNRGLYLIIKDAHLAVFLAMCVSVFINYLSIKKFFLYIKNKENVV